MENRTLLDKNDSTITVALKLLSCRDQQDLLQRPRCKGSCAENQDASRAFNNAYNDYDNPVFNATASLV